MKTYAIRKMKDGICWKDIPTLEIDHPYLDTPLSGISAHARIAYDDEAILVNLFVEEKEIRAVETGPIGSPCEDSCLEFFFCPMEGDSRYFNIEFNSNGCMYLGFGTGIPDLVRLLPDENNHNFEPDIYKNENGWGITYKIPFAFIRRFFKDFNVYEGKTIAANCYKCSDLTVPANYFSWNEVTGEPFTFHRPSCFGKMTFVV
ncbi:MAG: hypothetical protein E7641_00365 [Ruminococcaceae bacterium]|nr:hypothetical protein [Oscillospiraceae bacterium]